MKRALNLPSFSATLTLAAKMKNIDFWFIADANEAIKEWFADDLQLKAMNVYRYFKEFVQVIWYQIGEAEDAISLFTRLNIGKVPLTSAELVKAMFLSRDADPAMNREKQEEIALQWDNIERALHDDVFWYFLTNKDGRLYQTRIDLVLDLIAGKPERTRDAYFTFFKFAQRSEKGALNDTWRQIERTFLLLKDWFGDHELYHKIGYLIASGKERLQSIYDLSVGKTKTEFRACLDGRIRESVKVKGGYAEMRYGRDDAKIHRLLLLFNVESVRQNGKNTQWFPFSKFKFDAGKAKWSLEHIHARNSERMRTQEAWKEWLRLHVPSVLAVAQDGDELAGKMRAACEKNLDRSEFEALMLEVTELLSEDGTEDLDAVSNLALLATNKNSALSNSTFDVKRNKVIEMDKRGEFIPFCTRNVFLKYYTPSERNQLHFWGAADREAYLESMNEVLKNYLEEPIAAAREEVGSE